MKLKGTKFQLKVWEEIKKIPKGSVKTYKEIACILFLPIGLSNPIKIV